MRPVASGGAYSGNGARRNCCCCCCANGGRRERRGRQNGMRVLGARVGVPTRGWRWPAAALPTPAYGRHVAVAGWGEAGAALGRERGGGGRPGCWLGRKGGGVGPAAPVPFSFFLNFFLKFFLNSFGLFSHFHPFPPKAKLFQNKNPTTLF